MQFYEKLIFLLNLTQATNRMLANELKVDPSLISRLRTGARGIPRNREHIQAMSAYFARRCTTEYQRQALSGMLGIKLTMKKEQLSENIYYWLCGETDEVGRFMRTFETLNVVSANDEASVAPSNMNTDNSVYYGNDGKRGAARAFYQRLLSLKQPCTIYVMADEADDWISEEGGLSQSLQSWGLNLVQRGFLFCQIAPPVAPVDLAFESLIRWLPIYMSGQVTAYFYPRLRDNVHRRTLVVAPGEIAMISNSLACQSASTATVLTTDKRLIQAYLTQFQEYQALCKPMQSIYTTPEHLMRCFTRFLSLEGARIQKVISLSAETAPPELMAYCIEKTKQPNLKKLGNLYLQELDLIEKNRTSNEFIDISYLASAEEVKSGKVPIILSYGDNSRPFYYTPETYILHLKNILSILETCENYHFVPATRRMSESGTLMVKEDQRALLVHMPPPPNSHIPSSSLPISVFEISQPEIVQLCREHLFRTADHIGYSGVNRAQNISQIKQRIRELQR